MPVQDGVRGDQAMSPQCAGQLPDEGGEHGPVRPVQPWSWVVAAEHSDLVTQQEQFDVIGRTDGPAARPAAAPAGRADTTAAATRRRSCPTAEEQPITA